MEGTVTITLTDYHMFLAKAKNFDELKCALKDVCNVDISPTARVSSLSEVREIIENLTNKL